MKKIVFKFKNLFLENILKIFGVCSILIMFEACYGTPKSAWKPSYESKNKSVEQIESAKKPNTESGIEKSNSMNRGKKINPI